MKPDSQKSVATRAARGESQSLPPARVPTQQRSRERLERILAVATDLIASRGSDTLRMGEVAERASISIGSLYQYFPDKAAIVQTLAERFNAVGRACVAATLNGITSENQLEPALHRITDEFYALYLAEPAMRDIWGATQADKSLQQLEATDGEAHATMLCETLTRLRPDAPRGPLWTLSMLTMQLIATAVRLAITLDRPEGDAIVAAFKRLLRAKLLESLEDRC